MNHWMLIGAAACLFVVAVIFIGPRVLNWCLCKMLDRINALYVAQQERRREMRALLDDFERYFGDAK